MWVVRGNGKVGSEKGIGHWPMPSAARLARRRKDWEMLKRMRRGRLEVCDPFRRYGGFRFGGSATSGMQV